MLGEEAELSRGDGLANVVRHDGGNPDSQSGGQVQRIECAQARPGQDAGLVEERSRRLVEIEPGDQVGDPGCGRAST